MTCNTINISAEKVIENVHQNDQRISNLNGRTWQIVSSQPNHTGGNFYFFKPKAIENPDKENWKGYPALEVPPEEIKEVQSNDLLKELGFFWFRTEEMFQVPDPTTVEHLWKQLNDKELSEHRYPLPALNIEWGSCNCETDDDFINHFFLNKIIISCGQEFIHDITVHLVPTLLFMYTYRLRYNTKRKDNIKICKSIYNKIQNAKKIIQEQPNLNSSLTIKDIEKLIFTLALFIDTGQDPGSEKNLLEDMENIWHFNFVQRKEQSDYLEMRYGENHRNGKTFKDVWNQVLQLST